jgi:sugar phosphate isomerase/epimerase
VKFLHSLSQLGLSGVAGASLLVALTSAPAFAQASSATSHLGIPVDRIGLVSFTIRDQLGEDARKTLEAVTSCGIANIEFSGSVSDFRGLTPDDVKAFSTELNINVPSLGVSVSDLADKIDEVAKVSNQLGASYVRISGPRDAGAAQYSELAALLNTAGAALKEAGVKVAYHNHEYEFVDLGAGKSGYDILLEETDPELVAFELDLYWAMVVDADPVALITENPGRFPLLHVKDARKVIGEDGKETTTFATVGQGYLDFQEIFNVSEVGGVEYYFIENDRPEPDGITSACEGYAYLAAAEAP